MMIKIPEGFIAFLINFDQNCYKSLENLDHHTKNNMFSEGKNSFLDQQLGIHPWLVFEYGEGQTAGAGPQALWGNTAARRGAQRNHLQCLDQCLREGQAASEGLGAFPDNAAAMNGS